MTKKKNETFEWVKSIMGALVIAFIIRSFSLHPLLLTVNQ